VANAGAISTWRLARLMIGLRYRLLRNSLRWRRRGRRVGPSPALPLLVALVTAVAYVGLFSQSFGAVVAVTDLDGQAAVLSLVVGAILLGTLAAKAAASDAVLAGSPENEFLLSRPTSLPSLILARSVAGAVLDPLGALFLFPVLVAAAITWQLGAGAWIAAAVTSVIVQVGVVALAQTVQIAVVRYTPPRARRMVWVALRMGAALTLAVLWMTGTWILRAPRALAEALAPWRELIAWTPGAELVRPLVALRLGAPGALVGAFAVLAAGAVAALALAFVVGRRAGMHGWEEAGASWAEANARIVPASRPISMATKDLRLIVRDRSQLLALVTAPIIFVGIQIFGAAGWAWSTASLQRVAVLSFSLCLYMATIGPLVHMQAERRSFWILRTVPVSIGRLMWAKARAWALVLGVLSGGTFLSISAGVAGASLGERIALACWVAAGAAGMAFVAVGLACQAADLSDDARPAIGPATVYLFLLVGGLYNVVLGETGPERWRWLGLYVFAGLALWSSGMQQAAECLDPEHSRQRAVRLGDAAVLALLSALLGRAVAKGAALADEQRSQAIQVAVLAVGALLAVITALYLRRRPAHRARLGVLPSAGIGLAIGGAAGWALRGQGAPFPFEIAVASLPSLLGEELIFRGTVQRALEERWPRRRIAAGAVAAAIAFLATPGPWLPVLVGVVGVSSLRAATGRTMPGFLARATFVLVVAYSA
jgi:hypothetical protein